MVGFGLEGEGQLHRRLAKDQERPGDGLPGATGGNEDSAAREYKGYREAAPEDCFKAAAKGGDFAGWPETVGDAVLEVRERFQEERQAQEHRHTGQVQDRPEGESPVAMVEMGQRHEGKGARHEEAAEGRERDRLPERRMEAVLHGLDSRENRGLCGKYSRLKGARRVR